MSYVTPITDRKNMDIVNQTSKGYFNLSDWNRIYGNALHVNGEIASRFGGAPTFTIISTPTSTTIPSPSVFNQLLTNIHAMQQLMSVYLYMVTLPTIRTDWSFEETFSYIHVNVWEQLLDLIHVNLPTIELRFPITGIAITGADRTRNSMFRIS